MAATVQLDKVTTYRGRAIVFYPSIVVTRSRVKDELEKNGFTQVTVWMDKDELPSDWPKIASDDVSTTGNTQVYLEGTWSKPSGQYASSGPKWGIYDYWIQKAAPKQEQPPPAKPPCRNLGDPCAEGSECCSGFCKDGLCAASGEPQVNLECASEGMSCESLSCCEGKVCKEDTDAYWGGGMRCVKPIDETPPTPVKLNEAPESKALWYVAGTAALVGLAWWLWPKSDTRKHRKGAGK